ncbi:MAG: FecR family protein [Bacteroidota bacterium]
MNHARLEFLFQRYRGGASTAEEEQELMEMLSRSNTPQSRRLLDEMWNMPSSEKLPQDKAEPILQSILLESENMIPIGEKRGMLWIKVAASISFIILVGTALYLYQFNRSFSNAAPQTTSLPSQHQYLKLPDGSKVILNNNSQLEYPESFDQNTREVYLTGEAFFDIAHDASKPFIVRTGKISTVVLGTAFNIKAYPDQSDITVTVTRGKVKVSHNAKVLGILAPDDQITFNKNSETSTPGKVNSHEVITWVEKDIYFDDVPMGEAMKQLEQRFGATIGFANEKLRDCKFTATFIKGEDLHQILDVICEFNRAQYSVDRQSSVITISGEGCLP